MRGMGRPRPASPWRFFAAAAIVVLLGAPRAAADTPTSLQQPAPTVGLFASLGYLGSPGANGAATDEGVRWGVSRHLALSFDFGYGVLGAWGNVADPTHKVEDRWWIMPAVAWVIPAGRAARSRRRSWSRFDIGLPVVVVLRRPAVRPRLGLSTGSGGARPRSGLHQPLAQGRSLCPARGRRVAAERQFRGPSLGQRPHQPHGHHLAHSGDRGEVSVALVNTAPLLQNATRVLRSMPTG